MAHDAKHVPIFCIDVQGFTTHNPATQRPGLLHARDVLRLNDLRTWPPCELPERGILLPKLSELALQMQTRRATNEAAQVRVKDVV